MSNERGCQCGQAHGACTTEFQYAVKLVCGEVVSQDNVPTPVAPGQYWTAPNLHNPNPCQEAHFRWKVAVAAPGKPGPVLPYSEILVLKPDEAMEIDCQQIMRAFPQPPPKFVKGWLVIQGPNELDVVAVYSGRSGPCGSNFFYTERVEKRCVAGCEDLDLLLNTGFAKWQTVSPTTGPVALVNPIAGGWTTPPPFGSSFVSERSTDGISATTVSRTYELCFDLCFGYTPPAPFPIQLLSDGPAQVFLNGTLVGNVPNWITPTTLLVSPNLLHAGRNCFRSVVVNGGQTNNPTGFAMAGNLHVIRGKCPCSPLPIAARTPGAASLESPNAEPSIGG